MNDLAASELQTLLTELHEVGVKLWLDGGELRYRCPEGALTPDLRTRLRDRKEAVLKVVAGSNGRDGRRRKAEPQFTPKYPTLPPCSPFPLPNAAWRRRHALGEEAAARKAVKIRGALDTTALERGLAIVLAQHDVLAAVVDLRNDEPWCVYKERSGIGIEHVYRQDLDSYAALKASQEEIALRPWRLDQELARFYVLSIADDEHYLGVAIHPLIGDDAAASAVLGDFRAAYEVLLAGRSAKVSRRGIQLAEYYIGIHEALELDSGKAALQSWRTDLARPRHVKIKSAAHIESSTRSRTTTSFDLDADLYGDLLALGRRYNAGPATPFITAQSILFRALSDDDWVSFAVLDSGREDPTLKGVVGRLSRHIPFGIRVSPEDTLSTLFARVGEVLKRRKRLAPPAHILEGLADDLAVPSDDLLFSFVPVTRISSVDVQRRRSPLLYPPTSEDLKRSYFLRIFSGVDGVVGDLDCVDDHFYRSHSLALPDALTRTLKVLSTEPDSKVGTLMASF